jgi:hypothetical protein
MKKFGWIGLALLFLAIPSHAQATPAADVAVGYSYFHLNGSPGAGLNGVSGSLAGNLNNVLGIVADLGVYHGTPQGVGVTDTTYMFGPRFSDRMRNNFTPFAQVLFGGSHLSASFPGAGSGSTNPFAYTIGGGVDVPIGTSEMVSVRPQFDYVGLHENGSTENCVRFSVGIVFHIGNR